MDGLAGFWFFFLLSMNGLNWELLNKLVKEN